jgi:putative spermidine/putrescine transport system ATP-binding protein
VAQGELLTILGPSGSGKTTLLKVVAGFETPARRPGDGGRCRHHLAAAGETQHRHGVPELCAVSAHDGGGQPAPFRCECASCRQAEIEARVKRALGMVQLEAFAAAIRGSCRAASSSASRWPARSSSIPQLVLMDEPLGALDKQAARAHAARDQAHCSSRLGITVVFVTHDQERGADHVRPHRRVQQGVIQQIDAARRRFTNTAGERFRRRLHRREQHLPRHDERAGHGHARRRAHASGAQRQAAGAKVGVLMRPERFAPTGINAFAGEVIESVYLGTSFKLRLACEGGFELLVRQPARGALPAAGTRASVGIEPESIHVF